MLNQYPWWKNLFIAVVLAISIIYALPNRYEPDPAIQVSSQQSGLQIQQAILDQVTAALTANNIEYKNAIVQEKGSLLIRLVSTDDQLHAKEAITRVLGDGFVVALNLAPTTPEWLRKIGAGPMKLGLDLSGGVHFLLEVDTQVVIERRLETYMGDLRQMLRDEKIRGRLDINDKKVEGSFSSAELRDKAESLAKKEFPRVLTQTLNRGDDYFLYLSLSETEITELGNDAVDQNLTTLRNRVNELGVAEPLVQRQGRNRIVVELPGVQDTAEAKRILGKTANLEFRLEADPAAPRGSKETFPFKDERSYGQAAADLESRVIITGENVSTARSGFDPETNQPEVSITLNGYGGKLMHKATRTNINRRLGVLFIEQKTRTTYSEGKDGEIITHRQKYYDKEIISLATIRAALGTQFRITGLDSPEEASELSLLLRAGALAAPMDFVEERTVGPSLGAKNIAQGWLSIQVGMILVLGFMLLRYRMFGVFANVALMFNVVILVAFMSLLSATLTLPGLAGIVLTVGIAVDANVLIFARIREELDSGLSPHQAINAGYERAFITIVDANITTLIVALILYLIGTGPIKGFAITLSVGIVTSMFTAIMLSRSLVNFWYGRKKKLTTLKI